MTKVEGVTKTGNETMKKIAAILGYNIIALAVWALELTPNYGIVVCGKETPQTTLAVRLVQENLSTLFGKSVPVVTENRQHASPPAIYIGTGAIAAENGIETKELDAEQLIVKALPDKSILITGGSRGIYYAAAEFLEIAGCRFFAKDAKIIPHRETITLSDGLFVNRKPFFQQRRMYIGFHSDDFYLWNKQNSKDVSSVMVSDQVGSAHTFALLSQEFPDSVFALTEKGTRVRGAHGQLCLSNQEARELMIDKMRSVIGESRQTAVEAGQVPAKFFRVTQNDNNVCCQCDKCRALVVKYGSESGLMLDFINAIAAAFPEINIVTLAYRFTRTPPKHGTIRAASNVFIEIALQSREWGDGETRNLLLPWEDERNRDARKLIEKWSECADHLCIWDYGKFYQQCQSIPYTALPALIKNIPFYAKNHVQAYCLENEFGTWRGTPLSTHAFQELETYVATKMMDDPFLDIDKLLDEYFAGYYCAAAPEMRQYLNLLIQKQSAVQLDERKHFSEWGYLDSDFFRDSVELLERGLSKVKNNQVLTGRVLFEVVPLYSALMVMWSEFELGKTEFSFSRTMVADRLRMASDVTMRRYLPSSEKYEGLRMLALCGGKIDVPPEVGDKAYRLVIPQSGLVNDSDSCIGVSRQLGIKHDHSKQPDFGIYDPVSQKTLLRKLLSSVPQDEKFHLIHIGSAPIVGGLSYVYAHWSWRLIFRVSSVFTPELAKQPVDVWVSAKFQGPAYVKDSQKENCFAVDYVLLVP